jgi:phosphoglucomutase/phosphomannomutase
LTSEQAAVLDVATTKLSPEALSHLRHWLTDPELQEFRAEIVATAQRGAWSDLEDAFYTVIPFGTGGRRGPRGAGPNRINQRTIAESARGLADWVRADPDPARRGIVIACDTRHGSPEFSQTCARVIAAAGVPVYLFESFRSTPELSFAVRHLRAKAGVMVSASHNPPGDNGFKAYADDGGQLVPPDDAAVMACVEAASVGEIPLADFDAACASGLIRIVGAEIDRAYQNEVVGSSLGSYRDVRIVFTPLHGVGGTSVLPSLEAAGFRDVHQVPEQAIPDGDFPNVANNIPNPEVPAALELARDLAEHIDADLAMGTDPDADRLGCVAKRIVNGAAVWEPMNGNQIGALLCYYVLDELQRQGRLPADALVMRTTVTTGLIDRIAEQFGVGLITDLLVGFKYVGNVLKHLDDPDRFVFGTEESHGYLSRPYAHDKDGANAALLLAEVAARMKAEGHDLWWLLGYIHRRFGYFSERLENYVRPGRAGQEEVTLMLDQLRERPPTELGGLPVLRMVDRLTDQVYDLRAGAVQPFPPVSDPSTGAVFEQLTLARDNLLMFHLSGNGVADGGLVAIRPSGTEPKCKFYVAAHAGVGAQATDAEYEAVKSAVDSVTVAIKDDALRYALSLV